MNREARLYITFGAGENVTGLRLLNPSPSEGLKVNVTPWIALEAPPAPAMCSPLPLFQEVFRRHRNTHFLYPQSSISISSSHRC